MKTNDYIPGTFLGFYNWQQMLYAIVSTNGTSWNIPTDIIDKFTTLYTPFGALFQSVSNKRTRTPERLETYNNYKADYVVFLRALVQEHLVRNTLIPFEVRKSMGLNPREPFYPSRPSITTEPIIALSRVGRAMIWFKFMVVDGGNRAKIHPDANAVELQFYFTEQLPADVAELPVGAVVETYISTRGSFRRNMGEHNIGRYMLVRARWVNTADASKSGPYSAFVSIVIS
jgi:hypothetical protein